MNELFENALFKKKKKKTHIIIQIYLEFLFNTAFIIIIVFLVNACTLGMLA